MTPIGSICDGPEEFARNQLHVCVARILHQLGFTHSSQSSLDILTDLMRRYMESVCANSRRFADHCGRTLVTLGDLEITYRKMSVDIDEMNEYMRQVRPFPPLKQVARFPVPRVQRPLRCRRTQSCTDINMPPWAPGINGQWAVNEVPISSSVNKNLAYQRIPVFPDFLSETATSLGLAKSDIVTHPQRCSSQSRSSYSRPPTRPPSRVEIAMDAEACSLSRPASSLSVTSTSVAVAPMFKRRESRFGKRKSQESLEEIKVTKSDLDQLGHSAVVIPSTVNPTSTSPKERKLTITRFDGNRLIPEPILATDLLKDPSAVVASCVSGRAAPPPPVAPPQPCLLDSKSLYEPVQDDEQPKRIVQLAILRNIFTLGSNLDGELTKAFDHLHGHRSSIMPVISEEPERTYRVVTPEKQMRRSTPVEVAVLPPLKLKISRSLVGDDPSSPSPASVISVGVSSENNSDDDIDMRKKHKKKKKKKKKRHRDVAFDAEVEREQVSPCEALIDSEGGIRLKIRLRPPSRPSSTQ